LAITLKLETIDNNLLDYKLTLSRDSTFNFHYYSNIKNGIPPEINKYGKENGLWKTMSFSINKKKILMIKNFGL
jgi:hypothetical protein